MLSDKEGKRSWEITPKASQINHEFHHSLLSVIQSHSIRFREGVNKNIIKNCSKWPGTWNKAIKYLSLLWPPPPGYDPSKHKPDKKHSRDANIFVT
jgi:hypothetical protein